MLSIYGCVVRPVAPLLTELIGVSIPLSYDFIFLILQKPSASAPRTKTPSGIPTPKPIFVPRSELSVDLESGVVLAVVFVIVESVVAFADVRFAMRASYPGLNAAPVEPRVKLYLQQEVKS